MTQVLARAGRRPAQAVTGARPRRLRTWRRGLVGFVAAVAVWWAAVAVFQPRELILPGPQAVGTRIGQLWTSGQLAVDLQTSLLEFVGGFLPGVLSGILLGALMARSRLLLRFLTPPVEIFRVIIPFSLVPLAVVWFGVGTSGKIFVVWYATVFVMIVNTLNGMRNVDPLLLRAGRMIGYSKRALTWRVVLPAALPRVLAGLQIAVSFGWVSVIAAEYIGSSSGLGYLITNAQQSLSTTTVMAGMVVIGLVGTLLSILVSLLERALVPYRKKAGW